MQRKLFVRLDTAARYLRSLRFRNQATDAASDMDCGCVVTNERSYRFRRAGQYTRASRRLNATVSESS